MDVLTLLARHGAWLLAAGLGLGVFLLWRFIRAATRLMDKNCICRLPLVAEQPVDIGQAGRVILWLEGPLLTTRFKGVNFELTNTDGALVKGRLALFRQGSSGFSKARMADRVFTIVRPGRHVLHAKGLGAPRNGDERHGLLLMRPFLVQTVRCILGIVAGAFLIIGSVVGLLILLSR